MAFIRDEIVVSIDAAAGGDVHPVRDLVGVAVNIVIRGERDVTVDI